MKLIKTKGNQEGEVPSFLFSCTVNKYKKTRQNEEIFTIELCFYLLTISRKKKFETIY